MVSSAVGVCGGGAWTRRARSRSQLAAVTRGLWARRAGGFAAARSAMPSPISGSSAGRARAPVQCPAAVLQNKCFCMAAFQSRLAQAQALILPSNKNTHFV